MEIHFLAMIWGSRVWHYKMQEPENTHYKITPLNHISSSKNGRSKCTKQWMVQPKVHLMKASLNTGFCHTGIWMLELMLEVTFVALLRV